MSSEIMRNISYEIPYNCKNYDNKAENSTILIVVALAPVREP